MKYALSSLHIQRVAGPLKLFTKNTSNALLRKLNAVLKFHKSARRGGVLQQAICMIDWSIYLIQQAQTLVLPAPNEWADTLSAEWRPGYGAKLLAVKY